MPRISRRVDRPEGNDGERSRGIVRVVASDRTCGPTGARIRAV